MASKIDVRGITRDDTEKSRRLNFENIDYTLRNLARSTIESNKAYDKTVSSIQQDIATLQDPTISLTLDFSATASGVTTTKVIGGIPYIADKISPIIVSMHGTNSGATERLNIVYLLLALGTYRLSIYLRRNGTRIANLAGLVSNSSTQPSSHLSFGNATFIDYAPIIGINTYDLEVVPEGAGASFSHHAFRMIVTPLR